ncbi:MAG: hypothetical protein FWD72_02540, partial [Eggerthellaceae bacterium]|nr:hypothetical protein [Eggerthellaceae bacterium]
MSQTNENTGASGMPQEPEAKLYQNPPSAVPAAGYPESAVGRPEAASSRLQLTTDYPAPISYQPQPTISYPEPAAGYPEPVAGSCQPEPPTYVASMASGVPTGSPDWPAGAYPSQQQAYAQAAAGYPMQPDAWAVPVARTKAQPIAFTTKEWIGVALAVALAILWFAMFSFDALFEGGLSLPGVGIPLFTVAFFAAMAVMLGKRIKFNPGTVAVLASIAVLSVIPAIYGDMYLRAIDCFLLAGLCVFGFLLMSGYARSAWCRLATVGSSIAFFVVSLFNSWPKPFRALWGLPSKGAAKAKGVLVGLLVAAVLLAIVLPLLLSADSVFRGYFTDAGSW